MEMFGVTIILLLVSGFLIGIIGSVTGIGGGVIYVPLMSLLILLPIEVAIDTSIFIILISSGSAFLTYLKEEKTDIKISLIFAGFSIIGSLLSSLIFLFIKMDSTVLKIIFATVLLITGFNMGYKANKTRKQQRNSKEEEPVFSFQEHDYKSNLKKGIPFFLLAGFLAHLLGIGGGVINTPALNIVLGFPIHNATAVSTSIIFFTALYNTIIKSLMGQINYMVGMIIAIGSVLGAIIGAKISNKIPTGYLKFFVALILMILGIRMYF